jgi:hypothetical protein
VDPDPLPERDLGRRRTTPGLRRRSRRGALTAFTFRPKADHIAGRLIVRRVKRLNPKSVPDGHAELFLRYRHHGVFTDSPLTMLQAEKAHRGHAIIEQVIADLKVRGWLKCLQVRLPPIVPGS